MATRAALLVKRGLGRDRDLDFEGRVHAVADTDAVVVELPVLKFQRVAVLGLGRDDEPPRLLVVGNVDGGVGQQRHLFLERLLVFGQLLLLGGSLLLLQLPLLHGLVGVFTVGQSLLAHLGFLLLLLLAVGLGLLPGLLLAFLFGGVRLLGKAVVGFLEEWNVVV